MKNKAQNKFKVYLSKYTANINMNIYTIYIPYPPILYPLIKTLQCTVPLLVILENNTTCSSSL